MTAPSLSHGAPVVPAVRVLPAGRGALAALEVGCPFCGARHWHSAGARPGDGDGHRLAHCGQAAGRGYVVREAGTRADLSHEAVA